MIQINLLPDELKKKKRKAFDWKKFPLLPILMTIFLGVVFFHFLIIGVTVLTGMQRSRIQAEWKKFEPEKNKFDKLKQDVAELNNIVHVVEALTEYRILWAKALNELSDSVPSNVWLSSLYFDERGDLSLLVLEGYASSASEEGASYVARFIKLLEDNSVINMLCSEIELGSMKQSLIDGKEVMYFTLTCTFAIKKKKDDA